LFLTPGAVAKEAAKGVLESGALRPGELIKDAAT
jgi:hypothetical protein